MPSVSRIFFEIVTVPPSSASSIAFCKVGASGSSLILSSAAATASTVKVASGKFSRPVTRSGLVCTVICKPSEALPAFLNASVPTVSSRLWPLLPMVTDCKFAQSRNALSPILVRLFGSSIAVIGTLSNALLPMVFMPFGIVTLVRLLHHANA